MLRFRHATGNVSLFSQMMSMDWVTDGYTEFFDGILDTQPIAATSSTPLYSNAGYQILGYALEAIAQKPFHEILMERIIEPLGLSRSSHSMPDPGLAVVPSDLISSQFNLDIGDAIP
jgi:CubicO group peptidase (beta-lactamase class C family)